MPDATSLRAEPSADAKLQGGLRAEDVSVFTTSTCQLAHLLGSGAGSGDWHSFLPGEEALLAQDAVASGTLAGPSPAH